MQQSNNSTTIRTTLHFEPLSPTAIPAIYKILSKNIFRTCDYSIGGIYMWRDYFNYEYCIVDDTLFIRGLDEYDRTRPAFAFPIGKMPAEESVSLIKEYCESRGVKLLFSAVPREAADILLSMGAGEISPLDNWSDYLYDISDLASLTGKAFNKKRNHVNRFIADNPAYTFEPLTADQLPEVRLFMACLGAVAKTDEASAEYERRQCASVLKNYHAYPFEGAVVRAATGEIVAFTIGEVIGDTLMVHIEKMRHTVAGAGETINKLFAGMMAARHSNLRYINREEDAGDPGLRRAKESYHPCAILHKYNVLF